MMRLMPRHEGYSLVELMVVVALIGIISVIAVPMMANAMSNFRLSADARGISNALSLAKMRAAATFTQARVYVDLSSKSYRVEIWDNTNKGWKTELGPMSLNSLDDYGYGLVETPPPNTQTTIAHPTECLNDTAQAIGNTACVLFNSRGIPVDTTGSPTGADALYVTDGTAIFGATVSATGMIRLWRTPPTAAATWSLQ